MALFLGALKIFEWFWNLALDQGFVLWDFVALCLLVVFFSLCFVHSFLSSYTIHFFGCAYIIQYINHNMCGSLVWLLVFLVYGFWLYSALHLMALTILNFSEPPSMLRSPVRFRCRLSFDERVSDSSKTRCSNGFITLVQCRHIDQMFAGVPRVVFWHCCF